MRCGWSRTVVGLLATLLLLQVLIMGAGIGGIAVVDAVRGYIHGEAAYTRAQQRAAAALRRYVMSGEASDFATFQREVAIPHNIGLARIVLETPAIPDRFARPFLVRGELHRDDLSLMISLFGLMQDTALFRPALEAWRRGDRLMQTLESLALEISAMRSGAPDQVHRLTDEWLLRIDDLDDALSEQEDAFAAEMGEAARQIRTFVIWGVVAGTCLLVLIGLVLSYRTVRGMAQRDQALIVGRQRFRDFAECAADWFWETDAEHRFTHISDRAGALLGFTPVDHFGMTRLEANGADLADPKWAAHWADLEARRPFQDFEYDRDNGRETKTIQVSGRPIFDSHGRFRGYRGAGRDVTAEKAAARRLKEAKRHAEAANRAKSAFLANMSHELRTPLNAIIGFAEVIRDQVFGAVPTRYTAYAGDIVVGGRHLLQLLNDILDLSKIEAGHMTLAREDVDLVREVDASLRVMQPVAEKAGLSLVNEIPDDFGSVSVDPQRLRQILFNLLSNAVKFSDNAGTVAVGADRQDDFVRVLVRDQGIGIAEEDHDKVLQPFGQAETHLARTYQGTGLGLALVKRFAEMHYGTVEIVSELGSGTTVVVSFADTSEKRGSAACQQPEFASGIPAEA